jgi:TetR/AcrR family transcriptional repressor of nem operon
MNPSSKNPVGRPREFDEDKVLDAAMDVFWLQGYESTSMADLLKATGLHKGSLYQAFGDKHNLFVQALRRYMDRFREDMAAEVAGAESGLEELRVILNVSIGKGCHGSEGNAGCMALNTLADKGSEDPDIIAALSEGYGKRMQMITSAVSRAQAEGSLRHDWTAERIATMVSVMSTGVVATLRGPLDREMAQQLVDDFLETIRVKATEPASENAGINLI